MKLFHLDHTLIQTEDPMSYFRISRPTSNEDYQFIKSAFSSGDLYRHVADIDVHDAEEVFSLTQDDWFTNPSSGVRPQPGRHRSSASGDIIVSAKQVILIRPFGVLPL